MLMHNRYLWIAIVLMSTGLFGSLMLTAQTPSAPSKPAKKKRLPIDESSTAAPRGKAGAAIEGIVRNADGKPAKSIDVLLISADDAAQRWTTTSDDTGHFRFESTIPPGNYVAKAVSTGLESDPAKLSVPGYSALQLQLHSVSRPDEPHKPPPDSK